MVGFAMRRIALLGLVAACLLAPTIAHASVPPTDLAPLIASVAPECVNISVARLEQQPDGALSITKKSVGSGFVVDPAGIIATNRHVTDGGNQYVVTFHDDVQLKATLIYRSPEIDLALLRVLPDAPLQAVRWGDSSAIQPGDQVLAIGNPLALASTATTGIVSALDRDARLTELDAFIQTDAAINPGNSGGPLFNMQGELIGMNTAFFGGERSAGLSIAIPGNDVKFILDSLRAHGRIQRGFLGARLQTVTSALAFAFGLPRAQGAIVVSVLPNTPAAAAGLQRGDILQAIAGMPTRNARDAVRVIASSDVGQQLPLDVLRQGKPLGLTVTLVNSSTDTATVDLNMKPPPPRDITTAELGITGAALNDELRKQFSLDPDDKGVVVTSVTPGSLGDDLFDPGDIILAVQDSPILTVDDILRAMQAARAAGRHFAAVLIERDDQLSWIGVPIAR